MYHILTTPHITIRPSGSWDCLHAWSPDVKCIWHELYKPVSRLSKLQPVSQSFSQPSLSILVQLLAPNIPNHCKPSQTIQKTSNQKHLRHIPKHPKSHHSDLKHPLNSCSKHPKHWPQTQLPMAPKACQGFKHRMLPFDLCHLMSLSHQHL